VGDYTILDEIGKGRFAVVYRAKHIETGTIVAIKESNLNPSDLHLLPTIQREAGLLQQLDHPNIVKIFEVVNTRKKKFILY
jgi:serine/threonine protein kinase